jgi:hypothetical protein
MKSDFIPVTNAIGRIWLPLVELAVEYGCNLVSPHPYPALFHCSNNSFGKIGFTKAEPEIA